MQGSSPEPPISGEPAPMSFGPLQLNPAGFSVTVHGRHVSLTRAEFKLFVELTLHPFEALDRKRLAAVLHDGAPAADDDGASSRAVDVHIFRLRSKLRNAGFDCIKTMKFVGYRFVPS